MATNNDRNNDRTINSLPAHKCHPDHCLCNAVVTTVEPPEVGRRVQAYSHRWEFITWHNGDADFFDYWRPDMEQHPCACAQAVEVAL